MSLIEFRYIDPLSQFGSINWLVLETSIVAIIGFFIAAFFVNKYYRKFYGVTEAPKGWKMFFRGLVLSGLYQLLKVPFTYSWVTGDLPLAIFLIFQIAAIGVLLYGLYLMNKEVSMS